MADFEDIDDMENNEDTPRTDLALLWKELIYLLDIEAAEEFD